MTRTVIWKAMTTMTANITTEMIETNIDNNQNSNNNYLEARLQLAPM